MENMIHHGSNDPVYIKKISLTVWTLRDEIETRIHEKLQEVGDENAENIDLIQIQDEYTRKPANPNNVISLIPEKALDDSEDEMAKAMAEAANETTVEEAAATESENPENKPETENTQDNNVIYIASERPSIDEARLGKGKTVLSEINMERMFFFTNKAFSEGQSIVIQFNIPKTFIMNADVLYCRPYNIKSRIISENNYRYRVVVKFSFLKDGERALLRQFLQSVEPTIIVNDVKMENDGQEESSGGDGIDDLSDLGL